MEKVNLKKVETKVKEQQNLIDERKNYEICPLGPYMLVEPYATRPYLAQAIQNSNLIIASRDSEYDPRTGETKEQPRIIQVGKVLEVGPEVKFVKPGMDVFFDYRSVRAIPLGDDNCFIINEGNCVFVAGPDLKSSFPHMKRK